ncbi:MAG: ribonuclease H-like domain-containing protein [Promethearchaeota archaeon]
MIQCSFQQVPDVNRKGELRLWQSGITSWQKLLDAPQKHPNFTKKIWNRLRTNVIQCQKALNNRDFEYFAQKFPEEIFWRLIPNLEGKILYFDIEATGLDLTKHSITTIATFDGKNIKYFVKGENLNEFIPYLENFDAITTFDGEKMDLPFIQKTFDFNFYHIHYDLFRISRRLGFSGGLKKIENYLGISRKNRNLEGIDGKTAIYLWEEYQQTKEIRYLDTLLAYNIEDAVNLKQILYSFYNRLKGLDKLPVKSLDCNSKDLSFPKHPDQEVLTLIKEKYYTMK